MIRVIRTLQFVIVGLTLVALSERLKKPPAPFAPADQARWEYLNDRLDKADARADSLQAQVLNAQHDAETAWIMVFNLADRIKKLADKIERVEI